MCHSADGSPPAKSGPGGKGDEPPRRREAVRLGADLRLACVYQAPLTTEFVARVVDTIDGLMKSPKARQRAAGARLATRLMEYNLTLAEKADKMGRLDEGLPTERLEHTGEIDLRAASRRDPAIRDALLAIREEMSNAKAAPAQAVEP